NPPRGNSTSEDALRSARSVARGLAHIVAHQVAEGRAAGLILVGGDGAEATLARLGATALNVSGAVSEGVHLGIIVGGFGEGLPVATKAGGFGDETTLTTVAARMLDLKEN